MIESAMTNLPDHVRPYRRTPEFTAQTVPQGLLKDHATKAGVWGVIHVSQGTVTYRVAGTGISQNLKPAQTAVIVPQQLHAVSLSPDAVFYVEFWR